MMHSHSRRHRQRRHQRRHAFLWAGLQARLFGPGELRLGLLSLLSEGPKHGYELMKDLEARSGGTYKASAGSVYPTLQLLEDEGLTSSAGVDGKRVHRLTDAGRQLVEDEAETIQRIWRRAEEWDDWGHAADPGNWEIARPAMRLGKAALKAVVRAEGDPEVVDEVRQILERARRRIEAL